MNQNIFSVSSGGGGAERVTEARLRAAASPHYSVVTGWTQMDVWALGCAEFVK